METKRNQSDEEDDIGDESSDSLPSISTGKSSRIDRKARNTSESDHKSDESSSLSLPNSFDNTPNSTPAASPAPLRTPVPSFDFALRKPRSGAPLRTDETMRKFYEIQVDKIRGQLAIALEEKKQAQITLNAQRRSFQESIASLQIKYKNEASQLKTEKAAIETQLHILEQKLKTEKLQFYDLRISPTLAQQYQKQSHDNLTLLEFVQMKVYELLEPYTKAQDASIKEIEVLSNANTSMQNKINQQTDELRQALRKIEVQKREAELADNTRIELEKQVKQLYANIQELKANAAIPPPIIPPSVEAQLKDFRHQIDMSNQARETLKMEKEQLEQKLALIIIDKEYLAKDSSHHAEKHRQLANELEAARANIRRLELSKETFLEQVAQAREESKAVFEHRMQVELAKLQDLSKKELDALRDTGKAVFERENRMLKDSRQDALQQLELANKKIQDVQQAYEDKVLEITRLDAKFTTSVAEVRNELKIKHFEIAQLSRNYEDKCQLLHQAHLEIDMLKQKVDALKLEFQKLETQTTKQINQLTLEREKIKAYEALEVEMDQAILQAGGSANEDIATSTFALIPTAPKRRFQHSITLAQKLVQAEQTIQKQGEKEEQLQSRLEQLQKELEFAKSQLSHVPQPQNYLMEKLLMKEDELDVCQTRCRQLQSSLQQQQMNAQELLNAKLALQAQLHQILNRRHELETLKAKVLETQSRISRTHPPISNAATIPPEQNSSVQSIPKWYQKLRANSPSQSIQPTN
ncbi:hypothetical protein THRCLA_11943 [Thraustotheca clavata]|uniref:Progesterone-induced-blocking factor 1 n=1 Tax=Thraustotheca clavata TaxID=74557 RepID=A0A1V9Y4R1_9STRA|nr:hypothetical protein THRCLA_11943 [Thraustotheca clavata]